MSRCGSCLLYGADEPLWGVTCEGNQGVEECADALQSLVAELSDAIKKAQPRTTLKAYVDAICDRAREVSAARVRLMDYVFHICASDEFTPGVTRSVYGSRRGKHKILVSIKGEALWDKQQDYMAMFGHLRVFDEWMAGDKTHHVYACPPREV